MSRILLLFLKLLCEVKKKTFHSFQKKLTSPNICRVHAELSTPANKYPFMPVLYISVSERNSFVASCMFCNFDLVV